METAGRRVGEVTYDLAQALRGKWTLRSKVRVVVMQSNAEKQTEETDHEI
jgi:hypothetical protein